MTEWLKTLAVIALWLYFVTVSGTIIIAILVELQCWWLHKRDGIPWESFFFRDERS